MNGHIDGNPRELKFSDQGCGEHLHPRCLARECFEKDQSLVVPWIQKWHVVPASQFVNWPAGQFPENRLKVGHQIPVELEALSAFDRMIQGHTSKMGNPNLPRWSQSWGVNRSSFPGMYKGHMPWLSSQLTSLL